MSRLAPDRENYRRAVARNRAGGYSSPMAGSRHAFTPAVLMYAPASPGVYLLWDRDALIFVGQAAAPHTILERLMDHYCGRALPCRATHCAWEVAAYAEADCAAAG